MKYSLPTRASIIEGFALIELIYAMHAVKAFNEGSADIKAIAAAVESCFNVKLGQYYSVFQGIRLRKTIPTIFLDEFKNRLNHRMSEMD